MYFRQSTVIESGNVLSIPIDVNCTKIQFLEHVQIHTTIDTDERGRLELVLQSPEGNKICDPLSLRKMYCTPMYKA